MSNLSTALLTIFPQEGGYSNDPKDPGGETNFGIAKRYHPNVDIKNLTKDGATQIYQTEWWDKYGFGRITDQRIATKLFSLAINMGAQNAFDCIKNAIRATLGVIIPLNSSILDQKTIDAINASNTQALLASTKSEAAGHYRVRVIQNPNLQHDETGLLNRAYS